MALIQSIDVRVAGWDGAMNDDSTKCVLVTIVEDGKGDRVVALTSGSARQFGASLSQAGDLADRLLGRTSSDEDPF